MKTISDSRVVLLVAICLGWPDLVRAHSCNSLYAAYVRDTAGLASCADTSAAGFYGGPVQRLCQGGESPNDCSDRLYGVKQLGAWQAPALPLRPASGAFDFKFLPACQDGTDSCATREVRCHDGTRPAVMIDGARDENPPGQFIDVTSDKWVFHMSGVGQPCDALGDHAPSCWEKYANPDVE
ncbi:MAG: hypothetical protein GY778_07105, partial [bacterium]|nr:hypothetical protein [bacterium]